MPPWTALLRRPAVAAAVATAAVVRLAWVVVATRSPTDPTSDPAEYLRIADGLAHGQLPQFLSGRPSAFFAPGYPAILAPFVRLADATGALSPAFAASLVNVVAGTATVLALAVLADAWLGRRAAAVAAWLLALAPGHVYFSSTAHGETVFTALAVVLLPAATRQVDRAGGRVPLRSLVLLGVAIGGAVLVRSPGVVLLLAPALVVRGRTGAWRGAGRATVAAGLGALVLLVPWTVRNGVQVGVWTPTSTSNATALCAGHHDDADGDFDETPAILEDCYRGSPYDDARLAVRPPGWHGTEAPDEGRWYRRASGRGLRWAAEHPGREVELVARKAVLAWGTDWDHLEGARNYADPTWTGRAKGPLQVAANLWLWGVEALAVLALVRVRAARRASVLWALPLAWTAMIVAGLSYPHYRHPAVPLLAALAGAAVAALVPSARRSDTGAEVAPAAEVVPD